MTAIDKNIEQLKSPDKIKRYDACENLRVAGDLPEKAILALQETVNDPDPLVADAAQRALGVHTEMSIGMREIDPVTDSPYSKTSKINNRNGFLYGGIAGFIGGLANIFIYSNFQPFGGVPIVCLFMPLTSPLAGALSIIMVNYLVEEEMKAKNYHVICSIVGFLAGFLPFKYYLMY